VELSAAIKEAIRLRDEEHAAAIKVKDEEHAAAIKVKDEEHAAAIMEVELSANTHSNGQEERQDALATPPHRESRRLVLSAINLPSAIKN
jgi:hypothetical protein